MEQQSTIWISKTSLSRISGLGLLGIFIGVLLEHGFGQSIGGISLYGIRDIELIKTFYGHTELRTIYWVCSGLLLFFVLFAVAFRNYVNSFGHSFAADVSFAFMIVEAPILFVHYGLEIALVNFTPTGHGETLLALFAGWDGIYNGVAEWIELGWIGALTIACWQTLALPRWLTIWAGLATAGLIFNIIARQIQLSESALMPTYGILSIWMIVTSIYLLIFKQRNT